MRTTSCSQAFLFRRGCLPQAPGTGGRRRSPCCLLLLRRPPLDRAVAHVPAAKTPGTVVSSRYGSRSRAIPHRPRRPGPVSRYPRRRARSPPGASRPASAPMNTNRDSLPCSAPARASPASFHRDRLQVVLAVDGDHARVQLDREGFSFVASRPARHLGHPDSGFEDPGSAALTRRESSAKNRARPGPRNCRHLTGRGKLLNSPISARMVAAVVPAIPGDALEQIALLAERGALVDVVAETSFWVLWISVVQEGDVFADLLPEYGVNWCPGGSVSIWRISWRASRRRTRA